MTTKRDPDHEWRQGVVVGDLVVVEYDYRQSGQKTGQTIRKIRTVHAVTARAIKVAIEGRYRMTSDCDVWSRATGNGDAFTDGVLRAPTAADLDEYESRALAGAIRVRVEDTSETRLSLATMQRVASDVGAVNPESVELELARQKLKQRSEQKLKQRSEVGDG